MESTIVALKKHHRNPCQGYIYCVYDDAVNIAPGTLRQVKCGKTTLEPVAYCVKTYGRHMGKMTISNLAHVSDISLAESLLFCILDEYRVNQRREVFSVPNFEVVNEAFSDLITVLSVINKKNPKVIGEVVQAPSTMVVEPIQVQKDTEKKDQLKKAKEEARMAAKIELMKQHELAKLKAREQRRQQKQNGKQDAMSKSVREFVEANLWFTGDKTHIVRQSDIYREYMRQTLEEQDIRTRMGKSNFFDQLIDVLGKQYFKERFGKGGQRNGYIGWKFLGVSQEKQDDEGSSYLPCKESRVI